MPIHVKELFVTDKNAKTLINKKEERRIMVESYSLWYDYNSKYDSKQRLPYPKFKGREKTEIAIIGCGLTGASNAYFLSLAGFKVTVLEAHYIGRSSTATSSGILTLGTEEDLSELTKKYGIEKAKKLWEASLYSIRLLEETISKKHINCDLGHVGSLYLAAKKNHIKTLEKECYMRKSIGFNCEFLDNKQVQERVGTPKYHAGLYSSYDKEVNPLKLTEELVKYARKKGAKIFEHSAVKEIYPFENKVFLKTELGELEADYVIVATDAYTYTLGLNYDIIPIAYQTIATAPLPKEMWIEMFPKGRVLVWDSYQYYDYFRPLNDNRLIIGGGDMFVGHHEAHYKHHFDSAQSQMTKILKNIYKTFPKLSKVEITHHWGGICGHTKNGLPIIGPDPKYPHIIYSLAYSGHGLAYSFLSGKLNEHYLKTKNKGVYNIFHPPLEISKKNQKRFIPPSFEHKYLTNYYNLKKKIERL